MGRWTRARSWQKLERQELRIGVGWNRHNGKNSSVAVWCKLQDLSGPHSVDIGDKEIAASVKRQAPWEGETCCKRAPHSLRSKLENRVIADKRRLALGRHEQIAEPVERQPRGPCVRVKCRWANKHAPRAVGRKLEDSLIKGISCEEGAHLVKGKAETLAGSRNGAERALYATRSKFVDCRGKIWTRRTGHYKHIIGGIDR